MPEFVRTRRGRDLNVDLLTPKEADRIREATRIMPEEFVRSEADDFVFLVRPPEGGRRVEAKVEKVNQFGAFQGLYRDREGRLLVFRSSVERKGDIPRTDDLHLECFISTLKDGRIEDDATTAFRTFQQPPAFFYFVRKQDGVFDTLLDYEAQSGTVYHRIVNYPLRRHGVGLHLLKETERHAAAAGLSLLRVMFPYPQPTVRAMLSHEGFSAMEEGTLSPAPPSDDVSTMLKEIPKGTPQHDLSLRHYFPLSSERRNTYYSEEIRRSGG